VNINVFNINVLSAEGMGYVNMVETEARARIVTGAGGVNTIFCVVRVRNVKEDQYAIMGGSIVTVENVTEIRFVIMINKEGRAEYVSPILVTFVKSVTSYQQVRSIKDIVCHVMSISFRKMSCLQQLS
jgi:hypothetical protein